MRRTDEDNSVEGWMLRDRVLDYGVIFAVGFGVAATIGLLVGLVTNIAIPPAIGFTIGLLGVLCLLSAGLSGGQYAVGGVGRGTARYNFVAESFSPLLRRKRFEAPDRVGLIEEASHGYRPEKDPVAFWLAIGGVLYIATGFVILATGS